MFCRSFYRYALILCLQEKRIGCLLLSLLQNLTSLPRSKQIDSCYVLDHYAEAFAGDCDLK